MFLISFQDSLRSANDDEAGHLDLIATSISRLGKCFKKRNFRCTQLLNINTKCLISFN